jgi:cation diffusion facilitator CzcD-associated flavoprotein CzcO
VKKVTYFNARVISAEYDKRSSRWTVEMEDGRTARAKYLIVAAGFAAKRLFPDWKGLDTFEGEIHHSSFWPQSGVDIKNKRIAVIGTGSTGVQLAQECAKDAASVIVFQRTPNLALPMAQGKLTKEEQDAAKKEYAEKFKFRMTTFGGFQYDFVQKNTFDDSKEEREKFYQKLWDNGGFEFWLATYKDMLYDMDANREAYNFWAKKTRARISDPAKREILAPAEPLHAFGTKRPSLEQNYYEMLDRPENEVVDIKKTPIQEVTKTGIVTSDGKLRKFDIIALATGFDSVTGSMRTMGLKAIDGESLAKKWENGAWTYLGMTCAGFPNMFFLYATHGPTAFSNGPSCVECQGDWIVDAMVKMRKEGIRYIDATREAEKKWKDNVNELSDMTLFPLTSSWYMGANVPGKKIEQLNYAGGIPLYEKECRAVLNNGFDGFITA